MPNYSILRNCRLRPLPVALAHRLVNTKLSDSYMSTLNRLYSTLSPSQRALCWTELAECGWKPVAQTTMQIISIIQ
ncbi:MAG TPA: hypothetical protein VKJ65_00930 [Phycisphaerae bacterium]|nr:hypothetical protein [Phycisphaerae bacterium]